MADEYVQLSVRLPQPLAEQLRSVAEERMVHQSLVVAKALERFLDGLGPPLAPDVTQP